MGATWLALESENAILKAKLMHKDIVIRQKDERIVCLSAELERTLSELGRVARELAKLRGPLPPTIDSTAYYPGKYGDDPMYLGEG